METHLKLAAWIAGKGMKKADAAKMFGTTAGNLSKWLTKNGTPNARSAFIIETETQGHIKMEEWV